MQTPRPDRFTYPLHSDPTHGYTADKARQGEVVLRKPWIRAVFAGGVIGALALGLLLGFYR
jgi:hypothetical protein